MTYFRFVHHTPIRNPDAGPGAGCPGDGGPARRWPADRPVFLREPRLPGSTRRRQRGGGQVLPVRAPELDDPDVREWTGRFLARIHTVGAARPFASRPALDVSSFGVEPRAWLLENEQVPLDMQSTWARLSEQAITMIRNHACLGAADGGKRDADPVTVLPRRLQEVASTTPPSESETRSPWPRAAACVGRRAVSSPGHSWTGS